MANQKDPSVAYGHYKCPEAILKEILESRRLGPELFEVLGISPMDKADRYLDQIEAEAVFASSDGKILPMFGCLTLEHMRIQGWVFVLLGDKVVEYNDTLWSHVTYRSKACEVVYNEKCYVRSDGEYTITDEETAPKLIGALVTGKIGCLVVEHDATKDHPVATSYPAGVNFEEFTDGAVAKWNDTDDIWLTIESHCTVQLTSWMAFEHK